MSLKFTTPSCWYVEWPLHFIRLCYTKVRCLQGRCMKISFDSDTTTNMSYRLRLLVTLTWLCQGFLSEMVLITREKYPACLWVSSRRSRASGSNTNLTWVSASGSGSTPGPAAPGWSGSRCLDTACSGTQSTQPPGQEHDWCGYHDWDYSLYRMESNGEPLKIHCSEITYNALQVFKSFNLEFRDILEVKGKPKMKTYWLLGENQKLSQWYQAFSN